MATSTDLLTAARAEALFTSHLSTQSHPTRVEASFAAATLDAAITMLDTLRGYGKRVVILRA